MRVPYRADDGVVGTGAGAQSTSTALIRINVVGEKGFTYACRTPFFFDVSFILIAEIAQGRKHRVGGSLSQATGRVFFYIIAELFQFIQILHGSLALGNLGQDLKNTFGTDTAGSTFAAGFFYGKLQEELGDINHTVCFIHNNQSAGAHHGADGNQVVIVNGNIVMLCRDTSAGRSAGLGSLEFLSVGNAAADLFDNLAKGGTHGDFHQTGIVNLTAQCKYLCSL